jgi:hypothetical protein
LPVASSTIHTPPYFPNLPHRVFTARASGWDHFILVAHHGRSFWRFRCCPF